MRNFLSLNYQSINIFICLFLYHNLLNHPSRYNYDLFTQQLEGSKWRGSQKDSLSGLSNHRDFNKDNFHSSRDNIYEKGKKSK